MKRLAIIVVVVLIVGLVLFSMLNQPQTQEITPNVYLPSNSNLETQVVLSSTYDETQFPQSTQLPVMEAKVTNNIDEGQAAGIASSLGIASEITTTSDPELGNIYIAQDENRSLVVYSRDRTINYNETGLGGQNLSENELLQKAQTFISTATINPFTTLNYISTSYLRENDTEEGLIEVPKVEANIFKFNFSPTTNNLPLITFDPTSSLGSVLMKPNGEIVNSSITLLGELSASSQEFPLKSLSEVKESLSQAKIIAFNYSEIDPKSIRSEELQEVTINEISLAYLYDGVNRNQLSPIYVLKGSPTKGTIDSSIEVTLYLPAVK